MNNEPSGDGSVIYDKVPYSFTVIKAIQGQEMKIRPLLCLFDSGSDYTWIRQKSIPGNITPSISGTPLIGATMAGNFTSTKTVELKGISIPEFSPSRTISKLNVRVMETECRYDIIFGRDFCTLYGLVLDFDSQTMHSVNTEVPMRIKVPEIHGDVSLVDMLTRDYDDALLMSEYDRDRDEGTDVYVEDENPLEQGYKSKTFKATLSNEADLKDVMSKQDHLNEQQQKDLYDALSNHKEMFNGKLGTFKPYEVELEMKPGVEPKASRAYPVPRVHLSAFKARLDRLVELGVLEPAPRSEWIHGSFIIPKKEGSARWIADLRHVNSSLRRRVYPIPKIKDLLYKRKGYKYVSILDLSDHYYTFVVKESSRHYLTTATPFGLFRYKRLPQGINIGPDVGQEAMENLLRDLNEWVTCYFDDIAIFSDSWKEHVSMIDQVCKRLNEAGFKVNPNKCFWAKQEVPFLGYLMTPDGLKPLKSKINAIMAMKKPENIKQLRSFLGLVTFYRDMWPKRSHILAPLTDLLGTTKYIWGEEHSQAFERMKALVMKDTLLLYPDPNKPFIIETDASDYQLGGVIKQFNEVHQKLLPIAFYSRKLTSSQMNYTTIEKELLSIVEVFKEFRQILLGSRIVVHTDHKNLTHEMTKFTTQRVLRWRLLLEEFSPKFVHLKGEDNLIADALSRVPMDETPISVGENNAALLFDKMGQVDDLLAMPKHEVYTTDGCMIEDHIQKPENDCLLFYPVFDNRLGYCDFPTIQRYQQEDQLLIQSLNTNNALFQQQIGDCTLICSGTQDNWKIVLTQALLPKVVKWYHEFLMHSEGKDKLYKTLARTFTHPHLKRAVEDLIDNCDICKRMKTGHRQLGQLAPRIAISAPWEEVHVDCIGNWKYSVSKNLSIDVRALTMIDPVTNLLEVVRLHKAPTAQEVMRAFENTWLSRYPKPLRVISDRGPEFIGHEFPQKLLEAGIRFKPVSARNPQSNGIIERVHQTIAQVIRVLIERNKPTNQDECDRLIEDALATAMHATRAAAHSQLEYCSPGSIAFHRDMVLNIPFHADLLMLRDKRQQKIDSRLVYANARRTFHDYQPGMQVYLLTGRDKLDAVYKGPYPVVATHTNGTVSIQLGPELVDRVNIRRIKPA